MTPELANFQSDYPVVIELPVQWGDMDALQHVNNVVYLRWFESARIEYLQRIEFWESMATSKLGPILASSSVRYKLPVEYPDTVFVGVKAREFDAGQMVQEYSVFSQKKNSVTTVGEARLVMYDFAKGAKASISNEILARIETLEL